MKLVVLIVIAVLAGTVGAWSLYTFAPQSVFSITGSTEPSFGSTITTINGSDTLSASRTVINTNFANLNSSKLEITAVTASTSLTLGTVTTGVWNGTVIGVAYNGTGSTSPTTNQLILGNGASGFKVVSGFGTSGNVLCSNGAAVAPSWCSTSIDTTAFYNWTNEHKFTYGLFATLASSTNATTTGSQYFTGIGSAGLVGLDANSKLYSAATSTAVVPQTKLSGAKPTTSSTGDVSLYTAVVPAGTLNVSGLLRITALFNNSGSANAIVPTIKIGDGTSSTTVASGGTVAFLGQFNILLSNMNSLSSQRGGYQFFQDGALSAGAGIGTPSALSYNTANNLYINAICHVVNASDSCILTDLVIEHIKP